MTFFNCISFYVLACLGLMLGACESVPATSAQIVSAQNGKCGDPINESDWFNYNTGRQCQRSQTRAFAGNKIWCREAVAAIRDELEFAGDVEGSAQKSYRAKPGSVFAEIPSLNVKLLDLPNDGLTGAAIWAVAKNGNQENYFRSADFYEVGELNVGAILNEKLYKCDDDAAFNQALNEGNLLNPLLERVNAIVNEHC